MVKRDFKDIARVTRFFAATGAIAFALSGCTQKSATTTTHFKLPSAAEFRAASAKSKLSSMTTGTIETRIARVMVNITGDALPKPLVKIWNACDASSENAKSLPSEFSVAELPTGQKLLIQVLVLTEEFDPSSPGCHSKGEGDTNFFYEHVSKTLQLAEESLPITLRNVGTFGSGEGRITGRWIDVNGNGPSGRLNMLFHPPKKVGEDFNPPAMVVSEEAIYGGWFELFAHEQLPFTYTYEDGRVLFSNVTVNSASLMGLSAAAGRSLRLVRPLAYHNEHGSGGTVTGREASPLVKIVAGYFGPGASAKKVCFSTTADTFSDLYTSSNTGDDTKLTWSGATANTAAARVEAGGVGSAAGTCPAGSGLEWRDHLKLDHRNLNRGGGVFSFRGPYMAFDDGSGYYTQVKATPVTGNIDLEWRYLPGTFPDITGTGVFVRTVATAPTGGGDNRPEYEIDGGMDCNFLTTRYGFSLANRVNTQLLSDGTVKTSQNYTLTGLTQTAWDEGRVQIVLCPILKGRDTYMNGGVDFRGYTSGPTNGGGGGGGGGGPVTPMLAIYAVANPNANAQPANACVEYRVKSVLPNGTPDVRTSPLSVSVMKQFDGMAYNFHSTAGCATPATAANITIPNGASESNSFWYKSYSSGEHALQASGTGIYPGMIRLGITSGSAPIALKLMGTNRMVINNCYMYDVSLLDASGFPSVDATDRTIALSSGGLAGSFYAGYSCGGSAVSSVTIPTGSYLAQVSFRPTVMAGSWTFTANHAGLSSGSVTGVQVGDATISTYNIETWGFGNSSALDQGECREFKIRPENSIGAPVPVLTARNLTILSDAGAGEVFTAGDCSIGSKVTLPHGLTIQQGQDHSVSLWVKIVSNQPQAVLNIFDGTMTANRSLPLRPPSFIDIPVYSSAVLPGACMKVEFDLKTGSYQTYNPPASGTPIELLAMASNLTNLQFFGPADNTCSGMSIATVNATPSNKHFYAKSTTAGIAYMKLRIPGSNPEIYRSHDHKVDEPNFLNWYYDPYNSCTVNACTRIALEIKTQNNGDGGRNLSFDVPKDVTFNVTGATVHSDSDVTCSIGSATTRTVTFAPVVGPTHQFVRIKTVGSPPTGYSWSSTDISGIDNSSSAYCP